MGRKTIELEVRAERLRLRGWLCLRSIVQVSGHRPHDIPDNPLPCQKKAVPLHSQSEKPPGQPRNPTTIRDFRRPRDEEALRNH